MSVEPSESWLSFRNELRARASRSVWVPLYIREDKKYEAGTNWSRCTHYRSVQSLAVHQVYRGEAEKLRIDELARSTTPHIDEGLYVSTGSFSGENGELGVRLALKMVFPGSVLSTLELSQDLVFALRLLREGDAWLRPEEGFVEVARLDRSPDGEPQSLLIRPEFLRDYMSARNMALLVRDFRVRRLVGDEFSTFGFEAEKASRRIQVEDGELELSCYPVDEDGSPYGGSVALFHVARTDEWHPDDLPILDPPSDDNVSSRQETFTRDGQPYFSMSGTFQRMEWIEPAPISTRVRHDVPNSNITFIIDADGSRVNSNVLLDDSTGRWLWFSNGVIADILRRRGSSIEWYTRDTAGLNTSSGECIHFGLNTQDLVVVYARDIARLDEWEQRIWSGFNVAPAGGLGDELYASQVRAEPAETVAPEAWLEPGLTKLSESLRRRFGVDVVGAHPHVANILVSCNRFRSIGQSGFLALAKDLNRVTMENLNVQTLRRLLGGSKELEKFGSRKLLERLLATVQGDDAARTMTRPLAGLYDLRVDDAHLPGSRFLDALALVGVAESQSWIVRGCHMIHNIVACLYSISNAFDPDGE